MKKTLTTIIFIFIAISFVFSQSNHEIKINKDIRLIQLQDSVFIHVTWEISKKYGRFSSNGMIIIKNGEGVLIDTPMDNEKTEILVEYIEKNFKTKITKLIIGHFHSDCMGGIEYIHKRGIQSICGYQTYEQCKKHDLTIPKQYFKDSLDIMHNELRIECRYFGGGHTEDNIVVHIPAKNLLFGGCLIKSLKSKGLGNVKDAMIDQWDITVLNILKTYGNLKTVIPGHGNFGGPELLHNTVKLVKEYKSVR